MNNNKNCEGCISYMDKCYSIFIEFNKDGSCPCVECVVKVICSSVCDEWSDWFSENL